MTDKNAAEPQSAASFAYIATSSPQSAMVRANELTPTLNNRANSGEEISNPFAPAFMDSSSNFNQKETETPNSFSTTLVESNFDLQMEEKELEKEKQSPPHIQQVGEYPSMRDVFQPFQKPEDGTRSQPATPGFKKEGHVAVTYQLIGETLMANTPK